jgi:regulator of replication initiation timing
MQQHTKVTIDDNDDDDDDDVKQEVTDTIEKFVQNRHVQTLKYLRHVIDENRHLRLHIEHLKRRQDDPIESPAIVDPIDPEDTPINEILLETPEVQFHLLLYLNLIFSSSRLYLKLIVLTKEQILKKMI